MHGVNVINWGFKRILLSKMATRYARIITGMPFSDATGGFKCWRRKTMESIRLDRVFASGYLFQIETTFRAFRSGFSIREIPIVFHERKVGCSKMNWGIIWEAVWGVVMVRIRG
jgi:dolichol-phosphate mannosyltransferase